MKKLELKHLVPYLPYGLKVYVQDYGIELVIVFIKDEVITIEDNASFCGIKPILRPLSDLTKEIEINGEKLYPFIIYNDDDLDKKLIKFIKGDYSYSHLPYWIVQKLFELHFDVYGLIADGLAIDINKTDEHC